MDNNVVNNSCLMLACALYTPINLSSIFNNKKIKDTGIELESHITLLYAQGITVPKNNLMEDIEIALGDDFDSFMNLLKNGDIIGENVLETFDLGLFENDSDYVVLKLKQNTELYTNLKLINKGLRSKYGVQSEYTYTPHMTLAELNQGTAKKYTESKKLKAVLENSKFAVEDLVISYGPSNVVEDREKYNLTKFHAVDRFFREENLKREKMD